MIDLEYNDGPVEQLVKTLDDQLPFAASRAINFTLNDIQTAERDEITQHFTLRRPDFILRSVKINPEDRATKRNLIGTIRIDPTRDFLAKFEDGGTKVAAAGHELAVPEPIIAGQRVIPTRLRPKNLQLQVSRTGSGKVQFKGLERTFMVEKSMFSGGILQRTGRGVLVLFWFQRAVRLPPSLQFRQTATRITNERIEFNFQRALAEALATAR